MVLRVLLYGMRRRGGWGGGCCCQTASCGCEVRTADGARHASVAPGAGTPAGPRDGAVQQDSPAVMCRERDPARFGAPRERRSVYGEPRPASAAALPAGPAAAPFWTAPAPDAGKPKNRRVVSAPARAPNAGRIWYRPGRPCRWTSGRGWLARARFSACPEHGQNRWPRCPPQLCGTTWTSCPLAPPDCSHRRPIQRCLWRRPTIVLVSTNLKTATPRTEPPLFPSAPP